MKYIKINCMRRPKLLGIVLPVVFLILGCAGNKVVKDQPPIDPKSDKKVVIESAVKLKKVENAPTVNSQQGKGKTVAPEVYEDNEGRFELIETPFGTYKKRVGVGAARVEKQITTKTAAPPSVPVAPETKEPEPVEKVSAPVIEKAHDDKDDGKHDDKQSDALKALNNNPDVIVKEDDSSLTGEIALNFEEADLYEVIRTITQLLGINFVTDANIRGKVTIQTSGGLKKKDLLPIFYQIMEINGLTIAKEGSLYRVIQLKEAPRLPIFTQYGRSGTADQPQTKVVMQIVPIKYISLTETTNLISPFLSTNGTVITNEASRTLIIVDKYLNIIKALQLIEAFDVNVFDKIWHRFYPVKNIPVEELAGQVMKIMQAFQKDVEKDIQIIPIVNLNTLIIIGSNELLYKKVMTFIKELDVPVDDLAPNIYVYPVKNGLASELAGVLSQVFSGIAPKEEDKKKKQPQKASKKSEKEPKAHETPFGTFTPGEKKKQSGNVAGGAVVSGTLKGKIRITSDELRNILIIEAVPSDYRLIENVLTRLDVLPRQVLIDLTIAEISLDDTNELGVEWTYLKGDENMSGSLLSASIGSGGLGYTIGKTNRWTSILSTLATDSKVNILSSPSILTTDNKAATINVASDIPVASAEYQYNAGTTSSGVVQTNIQYRNTGVVLSVTPHISQSGMVTMDVSQEVSNQSDGVSVGGKVYPSFRQRSVKTTLTVQSSQSIVIGGMIQETMNKGSSGVPFLSKIPLIGYLFGKKNKSISKTELILMITPRVITSLEDVDSVTKEFREKVSHAMENFSDKY